MRTFKVRAVRGPGWWELTTSPDDGVELAGQVTAFEEAVPVMRNAIAEALDTSMESIEVLVIPELLPRD